MVIFLLGLGSGVPETMGTEDPWGWFRHRVAGRYGQAPSRLLLWAKEFKQALNLNRHKASPPLPPNKTWQFPCAGLSLAVAGQLVPAPIPHPPL